MTRRGSLLFSAPRAHYGGDRKTIEVLCRVDEAGIRYERIGRLIWKKFGSNWHFVRLERNFGALANRLGETRSVRDDRIVGATLREAKRLVDRHYGIGDHPK